MYIPNQSISLSIPPWLPPIMVVAYLCIGLGAFGLLDNNEGLYAEIAREMAHGSSLVIPHVLGVPYMEKPPLLYYFVAISFRILGETEVAARMVPMISSLICLVGVNNFCSRIGRPESGRLAVIILTTSLGYMLMSRLVMFDMLFTAFLALAVFNFYSAWSEQQKGRLRFAYAFLALALLSKGFVALVLFGLIWVSYFLFSERSRFWKAFVFMLDVPAILIFLAIALPWHIMAIMQHPKFAWFYFINEHLLRFLGKRVPADYYSGSIFYYIPRVLIFLFPWTFFMLLTVGQNGPTTDKERLLNRFLWTAWLVPLVFFSLSSAKANYYLIVSMPALAVLIALQVQVLVEGGHCRLLALPSAVLLLTILIVGVYVLLAQGLPGLATRPDGATWLSMSAIGTVITIGALLLALLEKPVASLVTFALLMAPIQIGLYSEMDQRETTVSSRHLAYALRERCPACQVLIYKDFENISSLAFYLRRFPAIIDSASNDLWFAQKLQPENAAFVSSSTLSVHMEDQKFIVVVLEERLAEFNATPMAARMEPAGAIGRAKLFVN